LLYAHNHSGDPGDSGPLGNLDGLVAGWMGGLLLLLLLPTGLALLVRSRFGYAFGLAVGTCSILWVVFSAPFGFYKLGGVAVLSLLHCALAGAGIIFLLIRPVGRALRRL
jgi:hypothetical protein